MKWRHCYLTFFIFFLVSFNRAFPFSPDTSSLSDSAAVGKYGLLEVNFTSDSTYANPYVQVNLTVQVSGPAGNEFAIDGYWEENNTWKARIMPTEIGTWSYTSFSNDPGLDSISGEFECVHSSRKGILIANPDYPYTFQLSEGKPFFWMGETSWWLMSKDIQLSDSTFHKFIKKRLDQKFNGIHFVLGTGGSPSGTQNPENEGGKLWISQREQRINPQFFNWMDKRIAYLDSVQMAIGFYITWSQHFASFTREEFERFERYLIARYNAYPLLYWIIVGEFDEAGKIDDYKYHGQVIDSADPYGHLISIHPNHHDPKNIGTNHIFADEPWCDIIVQQLPQFPVWSSHDEVHKSVLADRIYKKPVANVEFGYENKNYSGKIVTGDWMRKYAWAIACAGGFFSYGHDETIRTVDLAVLESDGARYMGYLYDFFQKINWWAMQPDPFRVNKGYCLSGPSDEFVIYLPDTGTVTIDFSSESKTFQAQWYNPIDGNYSTITEFEGGNIQSFRSYYGHDAVLHIWQFKNPPTYQISGEVTYFHEQSNVAETILDLKCDEVTLNDTTDVTGLYRFECVNEKYYELVPKKFGDQRDAISGADALLILEHLAFQTGLTDDQNIVADVTGNNLVETSDALAIVNYLVFLKTHIATTGQWRFDPDSSFFWLKSDTTLDFKAMLLGDVNGNWGNSKIISGTGGDVDTTATMLHIARINVANTKQFSIPVAIDSLDMPFRTLVFSIKYNPDVLKFISARKTGLSDQFFLVTNGNEPGKIHFAMVGIHEIAQPGEIIELGFENINKNLRIFSAELEIETARINDLQVTNFKNGRVILGKPKFVNADNERFFAQNYPNPFNTATTIIVNLANDARLKISVYNMMGQLVKLVHDKNIKPGFHEITWNGKNETGEALPSGIYFYRIEAIDLSGEDKASHTVMKKMVLIR